MIENLLYEMINEGVIFIVNILYRKLFSTLNVVVPAVS